MHVELDHTQESQLLGTERSPGLLAARAAAKGAAVTS
jgi:hypothetical protein